jgi:serine/threonine-protein kinase
MAEPEPESNPLVQRAQARIGQVLRGKWRIDRLLGIGGMAAVYEGMHRNGKRGAIKLLHPEISVDADARRRFLQEGYAANRVEHPGVVSVLDDDVTEDGAVFLVMELLDGRSVGGLAEAQPGERLDLATTLTIADQVLDVLAAAHQRGIVHRDLKPDNLFMSPSGTLKVLDFGLARIHEHQSSASATRTGNLMGTPAFMAPEQALGNWSEVDGRTDLWAIGATLFTLLAGRLVHQAATVSQLLLAAMTKPAPPLRTIQADVPAAIAAVIDRALAFDRDARWPDARSMQLALREASKGVSEFVPAARPFGAMGATPAISSPSLLGATYAVPSGARRPGVRSRKVLFASIAGAVLVGVLSGVAIVSRGQAPSAPFAVAAPPGERTSASTLAVTAPPTLVVAASGPTAIASAPEPAPLASSARLAPSAPSSASAGRAPAPGASARASAAVTSKPIAPPPVTGDPFGGGFH